MIDWEPPGPSSSRKGLPSRRQVASAVALGAAALAVLAAVILLLPGLVVAYDLAGSGVSPDARLTAVNNVRTTLLQAVGGVVLFVGAYATWRQLRLSQDGLRVTREGQITDRFGQAVGQIGSDKLDVRIGGLYALWRVADHSPRDRAAVVAIMAAFLRTHLPWRTGVSQIPDSNVHINDVPPLETRAPDAQVALTGLGVLCEGRPPVWLNLMATDLRRADCDGLNLQGVIFDRASLEAASIYSVDLTKASLIGASLRHAELSTSVLQRTCCASADLRGARLQDTDLQEADFLEADLREAVLRRARGQLASFRGADLRGADLRGADLRETDLRDAKLEGALASASTRWPTAFDVTRSGIVVADEPPDESTLLSGPRRSIGRLRSLP